VAGGSPLRAQQIPLQDKPFAEHKVVLQLSESDPKKAGLVISVANNLMKFYDPTRSRSRSSPSAPASTCSSPTTPAARRSRAWSRRACASMSVSTPSTRIERETGKRPEFLSVATPVQVGVAQILHLTENGYTLVTVKASLRAKRSNPCLRNSGLLRRCAPRNEKETERSLACSRLRRTLLRSPRLALLAGEAKHRLAIHVDQNDAQVMNLALNNATNVIEYYRAKNEDVDVDIVDLRPRPAHAARRHLAVKDRLKRLKELASPATCNIRPATTPNRAWRRPKARRCRSSPRPRSCPPAWSA
jgi:intracellular sulfur oxidation DsrE/DsrF family protein